MARNTNIAYTRIHDLTIEEVKACPTFQHMTEQEAKELVETFKLFTKIAYDVYKSAHKKNVNAE